MTIMRPATKLDVNHVAANLREADAQELLVLAKDNESLHDLVSRAAQGSRECYAIYPKWYAHSPVALFGVADDPNNEGYGAVWFVATDAVSRIAVSLVKEAPLWLDHLARSYPNGLHNCADKRNTLHLRWCEDTGFTLGNAVDIRGHPFIYISRTPCVTH